MVLDNKGFIGLGNKKIKVSKVSDQVWFRQGSGLILVFWLCPPLCIGFVPMLVARELQRFQACQGHRTFISFLRVRKHLLSKPILILPLLFTCLYWVTCYFWANSCGQRNTMVP